MKIPLEKEPFAPVHFTPQQEKKLEWLADAVIDETLAEYDDFIHTQNRVLDKKKWKEAMSRENMTLYKRIGKGDLGGCTPEISLENPEAPPTKCFWKVPKVVGVGTMAGNLEQLVYGWVAVTKPETFVRTTYIKDAAADGRIIANLISPTEAEPLRSLVVRWSLYYQLVHKLGVTPRDTIALESTGIRVLPNGDRIGYVVIHTVDVPGCGSVDGLIRFQISSCFLFRDTGAGTIDLYMRGYVVPGGNMSDTLAVFTTCVGLVSLHRLMMGGLNKKLAWMVRNAVIDRAEGRTPGSSFDQALEYDLNRTCPVCIRSVSGLRSPVQCDICSVKVCSRCIEKKKLSHVRATGKIVRVATRVCKTCITTATRTSAAFVSLCEHSATRTRTSRHNSVATSSSHSSQNSNRSHNSMNSWNARLDATSRSMASETERSTESFASTIDDLLSGYESDGTSTVFPASPLSSSRPTSLSVTEVVPEEEEQATGKFDQEQLQLWFQMNKLRVAAEDTYLLTKQNSSVMLEGESVRDPQRTHYYQ